MNASHAMFAIWGRERNITDVVLITNEIVHRYMHVFFREHVCINKRCGAGMRMAMSARLNANILLESCMQSVQVWVTLPGSAMP